jgi:hypothetical protein
MYKENLKDIKLARTGCQKHSISTNNQLLVISWTWQWGLCPGGVYKLRKLHQLILEQVAYVKWVCVSFVVINWRCDWTCNDIKVHSFKLEVILWFGMAIFIGHLKGGFRHQSQYWCVMIVVPSLHSTQTFCLCFNFWSVYLGWNFILFPHQLALFQGMGPDGWFCQACSQSLGVHSLV